MKKLVISPIVDAIHIGKRIEALRNAAGETQPELAAALSELLGPGNEVSRPLVGMWETAQRIPRADHILALANHFNVGCSFILEGAEDPISRTVRESGIPCEIVSAVNSLNLSREDEAILVSFIRLAADKYVLDDFVGVIRKLLSFDYDDICSWRNSGKWYDFKRLPGEGASSDSYTVDAGVAFDMLRAEAARIMANNITNAVNKLLREGFRAKSKTGGDTK